MATEILVNDGGAPARILPFTAGGTVAAGDALQMDTNTEIRRCIRGNDRRGRKY